ncbi:MAG TPA: SDR family oxidoreductase [Acidimicrobiales bacterium]|nr:SDR family oxidoreductase [Acidimicrobiales bacterium]
MDLELEGKVVLVTGGSTGLGRALARRLVDEQAKVAICARGEEQLRAAAEELRAAGGDVLDLVVDVSAPTELARLVGATVERFGRLDGLVNNAGRSAAKPVDATTDAEWDEDLQLKLYAAVRLVRLALPELRKSRGAILNVLAIAAKAPAGGSAPSSVSRAAGMALTKALSKELGPEGIRVNAVLIGMVESAQYERMAAAAGRDLADFYRELGAGAGIPLGRMGRAEEFGDLAAYLLSPRASYVTGVAVNLDGGLSAAV